MKVNYVAFDGKVFEDEHDCKGYEEDLIFKTILKGVDCRDSYGRKITDLEEIGNCASRVSIDSNESYEKFCEVLEDNEIDSDRVLKGIDGAGEYIYDDDYDDRFRRLKSLDEVIEDLKTSSIDKIMICKARDCDLYYTIEMA